MEVYGPRAKKCKAAIFCNSCRRHTNHTLEYAASNADYTDEVVDGELLRFYEAWLVWKCDGCASLVLQVGGASAEQFQQGTFDPQQLDPWKTFPDEPIQLQGPAGTIPTKLFRMLWETIFAYNNQAGILCTMGVRAILEGICDDKGIEGKNLKEKIGHLTDIPLPQSIVDNLHTLRFIGNDAAHELDPATIEEQEAAIGICMNLLNLIYELDSSTRRLVELYENKKRASIKTGSEGAGNIIPFRIPGVNKDQQPDNHLND